MVLGVFRWTVVVVCYAIYLFFKSKIYLYFVLPPNLFLYSFFLLCCQLRELERWDVDILMATLRRLVNLLERGRVSLQMIIRYLALKEATDQTLDICFEL